VLRWPAPKHGFDRSPVGHAWVLRSGGAGAPMTRSACGPRGVGSVLGSTSDGRSDRDAMVGRDRAVPGPGGRGRVPRGDCVPVDDTAGLPVPPVRSRVSAGGASPVPRGLPAMRRGQLERVAAEKRTGRCIAAVAPRWSARCGDARRRGATLDPGTRTRTRSRTREALAIVGA